MAGNLKLGSTVELEGLGYTLHGVQETQPVLFEVGQAEAGLRLMVNPIFTPAQGHVCDINN